MCRDTESDEEKRATAPDGAGRRARRVGAAHVTTPLRTPFEPPLEPMLARTAEAIPTGAGWLYEPKWDGFRALVFFDGAQTYLQSRDLKPLGRYFPELETGLAEALPCPAVLDGEIVLMTERGLDFEALQTRLHPAASRVRKLAAETPTSFVAFDLLALGTDDLCERPFEERQRRLAVLLEGARPLLVATPATTEHAIAADWFDRFEGAGFDGVIAKRLSDTYQPGVHALMKVKHVRTADCVVGGFRWAAGQEGRALGSLLLGLYDSAGVLHHVGHTSSFKAAERRELIAKLAPHMAGDGEAGFGRGRTPGAPSRWSRGKNLDWVWCARSSSARSPSIICRAPASGTGPRSAAGVRTSPPLRARTTSWRRQCPPSCARCSARRLGAGTTAPARLDARWLVRRLRELRRPRRIALPFALLLRHQREQRL